MTASIPWRIVHADVAGSLPALEADASIGAVLVIAWHRDLPLGALRLHSSELPLSSKQLAQRVACAVTPAVGARLLPDCFVTPPSTATTSEENPVRAISRASLATFTADLTRAGIEDDGRETSVPRPRLSVIVCTRDRPEALTRCLEALCNSREPADEIIVVDNAPISPATREAARRFPAATYVLEPKPGLSVARNAGIRSASADVIAFTDDDVCVHPAWTTCVRDALADDSFSAMTGLVLPSELGSVSQIHFETQFGGFSRGYRRVVFDSSFFAGLRAKGVPVWNIGAGANMAFRRDAFRDIGGFDERLGAGAAGCSEDSELWYRLLAAGHRCIYVPDAVVFHRHRGDIHELRSQLRLYMRGHVTALLVQFSRHRHWGNLARIALQLPAYYVREALTVWMRPDEVRGSALRSEIAGAFAGLFWYARHRRDPALPASLEPR